MKLSRPLVFLDIESATDNPNNPNPQYDRIIDIAAIKFLPTDEGEWPAGLQQPSIHHRYNPGIPINPECSAVHGITEEHVKGLPPFDAPLWWGYLDGCDLAGFGIWHYDLPLIVNEFARNGLHYDWRSRVVIDAGMIFKKKEERTLSAAMKFYWATNHDGAHSAMADTQASVQVLQAQLDRYPDVAKMTFPELHLFCQFDERLTLDGKIAKGPDGDPIFTFGKSKGMKVHDDQGFAEWMLNKDFPHDTKVWIENYFEKKCDHCPKLGTLRVGNLRLCDACEAERQKELGETHEQEAAGELPFN